MDAVHALPRPHLGEDALEEADRQGTLTHSATPHHADGQPPFGQRASLLPATTSSFPLHRAPPSHEQLRSTR